MFKGPLVRQTLAQSAERKKYMDVTEALKRERETVVLILTADYRMSIGMSTEGQSVRH